VWSDDLQSSAVPALPTTWSQQTTAATGWRTDSAAITLTGGWVIPKHTKFAVIDDWNKNEANNPSILVSPYLDLSSTTGAFLKFEYYFNKAFYTGGTPIESFTVKGSIDSGKTWTDLKSPEATPNAWGTAYVDLSAYDNKADVLIGFAYYDGGSATQKLIGAAIDDISVFVPPAYDISLKTINMPVLYDTNKAAAATTPVKVSAMNLSGDTVTSIDMQYVIDGGTPVTQTFTGLSIAPFTSTELTFTTPVGNTSLASHAVTVSGTTVNGGTDPNTADNAVTAAFLGASKSVAKACLIEEFTSSTCPPCASFNVTFDPLIEANNVNKPESNFNTIKYQMNWPNPGNDASYNPHGNTRKGYYNVGGIPDHYTNGKAGGSGGQAEIDECKKETAFVEIDGSYTITNDSAWTQVSVTPYFNLSRAYKVYIALVEIDYWNPYATTTQSHYYHAMRRMLPSGSGYSANMLADNTALSYQSAIELKTGNVTQGSYNLWSHPKNTNLVVFIQDDASKNVLQSKVIPSKWPVGIEEKGSLMSQIALYPNPSNDYTTVGFNLEKAAEVKVEVTDMVGRTVYASANKLAAGFAEVRISTAEFTSGLYNVKISAENKSVVKRLSVVK
jgi:hypothetical protein